MFKKSPLKATKIQRKKAFKRIFLYIFFSCLISGIVYGTVKIMQLPVLQITTVHVEGNAALDAQDISRVIAQDSMGQNYFYFFPKTNKLIYPKQQIISDLRNQFALIDELSLSVSGHELDVQLTERKPKYVWCAGESHPQNQNDNCYFMDLKGYVYGEAPRVTGDVYVTFFGPLHDQSGNPLNAQANPIQVDWITALDPIDRAAYIHPTGKIYFKSTDAPESIVSTVVLLKNKHLILNPQATSTLDYVDLRYGSKVYYKFVGEN
jgi:hypothetical protein